ncbi:MAG: hypothetical protein CVU36_12325 [Betaproteobacteria bacterium HGW-Betaproteobacteria-9]|jgi:type IV pili sensor histidine kinase/response regulator|nr:MAG: hypothetical protein CVU36_12325 [Betaproteobacteria bacterium HGW-Betaproteobacteria-9]
MQGVSMKQGFLVGLMGLVMWVPNAWAQTRLTAGGDQVQVGRYTTQSAQPPTELAEPMNVYAQLTFPRQAVETVGQAIDYTLMRTGYRLVDIEALGGSARRFLSLTLPESQRSMGPYQVKTILQTLLGSAWTLRTDPVTRQVWFELEAVEAGASAAVVVQPEQVSKAPEPVAKAEAQESECFPYDDHCNP